jgi:multiple sugar transport system ATP-binding protein
MRGTCASSHSVRSRRCESAKRMAGVSLENVSRTYPGGAAAACDVSLEVFDREFLVLVGPSGCGKTTTLRLIAGLEEPSSGKIWIGGRLVNDVPAKNRDIAMVFQNYALYPHMTVYRNLAFGLELREGASGWSRWWRWGLSPSRRKDLAARRFAIAERVHEVARVLGIEHLLERLPGQLSGGERQRVALGRAIVRNPAVFLFDEPLSNLDAKLRVEMRRELKQLHQRLQTTMIYVTHDQVEALTLGDRIVVMQKGRIEQVGSPMEVYQRPVNRFVAGFIGTPTMNFIPGQLIHESGLQFRRGAWSIPLEGRDIVPPADSDGLPVELGVRPEDIQIFKAPQPATQPGRVEMIENLGDAAIITVALTEPSGERHLAPAGPSDAKSLETKGYEQTGKPDLLVVCKMEVHASPQPGERVHLGVDRRRVHVFETATGRNLAPAALG